MSFARPLFQSSSIPGPDGPQGEIGPTGPQGIPGTATNTGATGTSQWLTTTNGIYYDGGLVGIGTATPTTALDVSGSLKTSQDASIHTLTVGLGGGNVSNNTAVGYQVLYSNTTGIQNVAVGNNSLFSNTTGIQNTAVGNNSLFKNTGIQNTAVGNDSLYNNTGNFNVAIGNNSLYTNTDGSGNVAVGNDSLFLNTTGQFNTALGGNGPGFNMVSGLYNTFLGSNTDIDISSNTYNYSTAIGASAIINSSNQIMLGGTGSGSYPIVVAPGGITGPTGSFNNLFSSSNSVLGQYSSSSNQLNEPWSQIYSINPTPILTISKSTTGQYIVFNTQLEIYMSKNYGKTFSLVWSNTNLSATPVINNVSISSSGQYISFSNYGTYNQSGGAGVYYSNNYGQSFSDDFFGAGWQNVTLAGNTGYTYCSFWTGAQITVINNTTGATFQYTPPTSVNGYPGILSDSTGNTLLLYVNNTIQKTTNGLSTSPTWSTSITNAPAISGYYLVDADDTLNYISVIGSFSSISGIYYSSNGGSSFLLGTGTSGLTFSGISVSNTGQYQIACINGGGVYFSSDSGQTWSLTAAPIDNWTSIKIDQTGSIFNATTNDGYVYQALPGKILPQTILPQTLVNGLLTIDGTTDISGNLTVKNEIISQGYLVGATGSFTYLTTSQDASIHTLTVGYGGGNVSTNTAVGYQALQANNTVGYNTAVGYQALYSSTGVIDNHALGYEALYSNTGGSANNAFGTASLYLCTGPSNSAFGDHAGDSITTGSNNTCIGAGADASTATVSNEITLGDINITALRCQVTTITSLSDARDKKEIEPLDSGLLFVDQLKPVKFLWNMRDGGKVDIPEMGFIAQDLKQVQEDTGIVIPNLVYESNPDRLEASYGTLLPILVKAVQELSLKVTSLETDLGDLKNEVAQLKQQISSPEK